MKKLILMAALSSIYAIHADIKEAGTSIFKKAKVYPQDTNVSLEIKNKGNDIFVAIKNGPSFLTKDGKKVFKVAKGETVQFSPDIQRLTQLYVWEKAPADVTKDYVVVSFPIGKTIYLTRHTSQLTGASEFNPQTGPGEGIFKKTDTALSLRNNVTQADIQEQQYNIPLIKGDQEVFAALGIVLPKANKVLGLGTILSVPANKVLSLDENADLDAIKSAYKKLSLKWHPDKNPSQQELATKVFQVINAANTAFQDYRIKNPVKNRIS